jgi:hypothetical protein
MNDIEKYFYSDTGRPIHKLTPYFDAYDRHFHRFRGKSATIMEVGVSHGGALQMWRNYFGPNAHIIGVDIAEKCKVMEKEGFQIFIGDQGSKSFWDDVKSRIPKLDLLIDDGSHKLEHQRTTFDCMYDHVKDDGVYLVEDCHSSYRRAHGGGHRRRQSFIEFSKDLVDELNAFWSQDPTLPVTQFTRTCQSIHFYDAIVVFEKKLREAPYNVFGGRDAHRFKPRRERVPLENMEPLTNLPPAGSSARHKP